MNKVKKMKNKTLCIGISLLMVTVIFTGIVGIVSAEWMSFGKDEYNSRFLGGLTNDDRLLPFWSSELPDGLQMGSSPVVSSDKVYVTTQGGSEAKLVCLEHDSGDIVWTAPVNGASLLEPVLDSSCIFVASDNNCVYKYRNSPDDEPVFEWESDPLESTPCSPLQVGSTASTPYPSVVFGTNDGSVYAINSGSGSISWKSNQSGVEPITTAPAVVDRLVYVGSDDGNIYCIERRYQSHVYYGATKWSYLTGGPVKSSPAVLNDLVYVGSDDGNLYCFNKDDGGVEWMFPTGGAIRSSPAVVEPRSGPSFVFFMSNDGVFYCVDAETGTETWSTTISGPGDYTTSPSVLASTWPSLSGTVYIPVENEIYGLDAVTGEILFTYSENECTSEYVAMGYMGDSIVFYYTDGDHVYAAGAGLPPNKPDKVQGPDRGQKGVRYFFTMNFTTDVDGDDLYYIIEWGDGEDTGWLGPYPADEEGDLTLPHTYEDIGDFDIRVKASDQEDHLQYQVSDPLEIHIDQLEIKAISGGLGVSATIMNMADYSKDIDWTVELIGGTFPGFHMNKKHMGTVESVGPGETVTASTGSFFGLGSFKITVSAECAGESVSKTVDGKILFFYVII